MHIEEAEVPWPELCFETIAQSHQVYDASVQKVLAILGVADKMMKVGASRLLSLTRHHHDLEFLVSCWSVESHTFIALWGEFGPTLEDVMNLSTLHFFGDVHDMGMLFGEGDVDKLQQLTFAIEASKVSSKST